MAWKFVPDDDFDLYSLQKWEKFFESDLQSASKHLAEITLMARKLRMTGDGVTQMLKQANKGIKTAQDNLVKVKEAILIAENRDKPKRPKRE